MSEINVFAHFIIDPDSGILKCCFECCPNTKSIRQGLLLASIVLTDSKSLGCLTLEPREFVALFLYWYLAAPWVQAKQMGMFLTWPTLMRILYFPSLAKHGMVSMI